MKLFVAALLLLPCADAFRHLQDEICDLTVEICPYPFDGACDDDSEAGTGVCPSGSDCFDCSRCAEFNLDCEACTSNGCVYCGAEGLCSEDPLTMDILDASQKVSVCSTPTDWSSDTCGPIHDDNVFSDPLYDTMKWAFDLIQVEKVWTELNLTGAGIHVRVNDDGVDGSHGEFEGRFSEDLSCPGYMPGSTDGKVATHGTTCASLIGAGADNDLCAVGIAPGATISACEVFKTNWTDEETYMYEFESVDVSSNSVGPEPCSHLEMRRRLQTTCSLSPDRLGSPCAPGGACLPNATGEIDLGVCGAETIGYCRDAQNYDADFEVCQTLHYQLSKCSYKNLDTDVEALYERGVTEGRGGKGTIYVFAVGNERHFGTDANYDTNSNSRFTIAVAAVGKRGLHASYSNTGSNVFVSAPGGDFEFIHNNIAANPIINGGGCKNHGPGTSFACPTVSGVVALILEANGELGWRDVQAIIAETATLTDFEDASWTVNGAGLPHSYKYGFGIIDAYAACVVAQDWVNLPPESSIAIDSGTIDLAIPDDSTVAVNSTMELEGFDDFVVETVFVYVNLFHGSRGDLEIHLISPNGTVSDLTASKRPEFTDQTGEEPWRLMTVRTYGENPNGEWKLIIGDVSAGQGDVCVNEPYIIPASLPDDGEDVNITCHDLWGIDVCDGESANATRLEEAVKDYNIPLTHLELFKSAPTSCCECGGGTTSVGADRLISWELAIYGHYASGETAISKKSAQQTAPKKEEAAAAGETEGETAGDNPDLADAAAIFVSGGMSLEATSTAVLAFLFVALMAW